MTPQALTELKARCQAAKQYGRTIANAAAYVVELEAVAGPVPLPAGMAQNSAGHLLALIAKVEGVQSGAEVKAEAPKASAPEPKHAEAKQPAAAKEPKPKSGKKAKAKKADAPAADAPAAEEPEEMITLEEDLESDDN